MGEFRSIDEPVERQHALDGKILHCTRCGCDYRDDDMCECPRTTQDEVKFENPDDEFPICKNCGHVELYHTGILFGECGGKDLSEAVDCPCVVDACGCEMFEHEKEDT